MAKVGRTSIDRRALLQGASGLLMLGTAKNASARPAASSRDRLEAALSRIADPQGEGAHTYLTLYTARARNAADAADTRARAGKRIGPLDGAIVSIKELFDVAGEPTRAGSTILAHAPPATVDAPVVQRLRAAGAVIVGKTNMVEFAFSGVGLNPHYGTPANPADRSRVPGGSSSGAGVAVGDAMCEIAIGSDTGGSTRIPAALCGGVGFKPSQYRVPREGVFPLSQSLDSIGSVARSVAACADADAILAGEAPAPLDPVPLGALRFAIPQGLPLRDLDASVSQSFGAAVTRLATAGIAISERAIPLLDEMATLNTPVPLGTVEAYRLHRERLKAHGADYDPFVRARMETASGVTDADYAAMLAERARLVRAMDVYLGDIDALVMPTTPIVAPTLAEVANADGFVARNRLLLRNTSIANSFDLCAISLPLPRGGGLPTGLMLVARRGQDRRLLRIAAAIEALLRA